MEQLPQKLRRKRKLAELYFKAFEKSLFFDFVVAPQYAESNFWLNTIRIKPEIVDRRGDILDFVNKYGYQCRAVWAPLNSLAMFSENPASTLHTSEQLYNSLINIPSSPQLIDVD